MRRFCRNFALPPTWLGAAAVVMVAGVLLRGEVLAQTRPASAASAATQPLTQPSAAEPDKPAPAPAELTFWELYIKGGYFMYPLTLCSVLAVALIIERFVALRRANVIPRHLLGKLRQVGPDLLAQREPALRLCQQQDSSLARMLAAGIKRLPRGVPAAEKAIEDAGANEALKLRRNMRFLYALGSVATLLGLIGTISGMIKAFQNAATSGPVDPHKLSTGIYEAMVNTFAGLAVAIVVTTFYYFFVGKIERLLSEMNDALTQFSDDFEFDKQ